MTRRRKKRKPQLTEQWYKIDLHLHTPASADFQEENLTYLDILQEAERKGLDVIAFTDHNTVAGFRRMRAEIENLELLERLDRLQPVEAQRLKEYRRLREKILLLTGFEFTATFGFHILGIFPAETPLRDLEFLLLQLNVPPDKLDAGATDVGATTDVLTAYRLINDAGGIVIAAHANSSHGVAMQGLHFGGQTRIAFTQDPHLHALEVTDLEKQGKRTTARFFDGSKPEYPRRMHCIQGSDTHHLRQDPHNHKYLGIGDRVTEFFLEEKSFAALLEVLDGDDFARTRPYRREERPFDHILAAREEGPSIVQEFHERYSQRGGYRDAILADICAFANTNGGTLYVGLPDDPKKPPTGVGTSATRVINYFKNEVETRVTPTLHVTIDTQETQGVNIVRIVVPRGKEPPYTLDESAIYIRSEAETTLAVRDEIVELVKRGQEQYYPGASLPANEPASENDAPEPAETTAPRTGVEIASIEERGNTRYYTMRDLRNGNLVTNVTRRSARRLWHYAIEEVENNPLQVEKIRWSGDIGVWKQRQHGNRMRYDLVERDGATLRVYYGVTEDGIHGQWADLVGE